MIRNVDLNGNEVDLTKIVLTRKTHPTVFQVIDQINGGGQNAKGKARTATHAVI